MMGARSPINTLCRAGASYFRLLRPLRALSVNKDLGACYPRKNFKIRHSEIASKGLVWAKKATRIFPSVVSVAREAIELNS